MIQRLKSALRVGVVLLVSAVVAACGDDQPPLGPPPSNPLPPSLGCAAPLTVDNAVGAAQPVTYTGPTVTNGTTPVTVNCTPASGAMFDIGETTVTCLAVDAIGRQATCLFPVTVRHRQLALTNFLAYGDSMTEGQNGRQLNFFPIVDTANSYPTILQQLFTTRIPGQSIIVTNGGLGGELITQNEDRLKRLLDGLRPQVLLFLEGANDMIASAPPQVIAEGVRESIKRARDRGVQYVFVSTLLPVAPENCPVPDRPPCKSVPAGLPAATNQLIRPLVPANGAYLVDPYDEFVTNRSTYISIDGLHLTAEGNRALASAFWNRIVAVIPARQLLGLASGLQHGPPHD
jgi:lysophospholipase L1-like esterase